LSGWAAVDVLRANGVPIDANIMAKVFPAKLRSGKVGAPPPSESMTAMHPEAGKKIGSSGNRVDESNGKCGLKRHGYWVFEVS
jgi:hypothetical protein